MIGIVLAAATALVWGCSDYCGGRASRGGNALGVTVVSQLFSVPVLAVCLVVVPGVVYASDLAWGGAAGVAGFLGIVLLYRGLATGAMAVVAPITAVTSAVVPMVVGLIVERMPSALALGGTICAVAAIGLVSLGSAEPAVAATGGVPIATTRVATARVVGLALSSGVMFGIFLVLLAQVHRDSGLWPLAGVRFASVAVGLALLLRRGAKPNFHVQRRRWTPSFHVQRRRWTPGIDRPLIGWTAAAGIGDVAANALFVFAARDGLLSVVGPIAALYPVSTVLLALFVDKERVRPVQVAGLGLAAAALILTAV